MIFFPLQSNLSILALGSEFDTRLAFYREGRITFSKSTGNKAENPSALERVIRSFARKNGLPSVIITDLHPAYNSRQIGERLAEEWKIPHAALQHHIAHIFTALGDHILEDKNINIEYPVWGIACDGTGYGPDGTIWGGEVLKIERPVMTSPMPTWATRIGHLEKQFLIGGEASVNEPARVVISIFSKLLAKEQVYSLVKKYYAKNEFEVIYSGIQQEFNLVGSSSCGRVLDAISIFLGLSKNERKYKHYSAKLLERHSRLSNYDKLIIPLRIKKIGKEKVLDTSSLFRFLAVSREDKDKLAVAAQKYIIEGLYEILKSRAQDRIYSLSSSSADATEKTVARLGKSQNKEKFLHAIKDGDSLPIFLSGGLADNKIFRKFAKENKIYIPQYFSPGDQDIALGQIVWYLLAHKNNSSSRCGK